jgi:hypothetical protein
LNVRERDEGHRAASLHEALRDLPLLDQVFLGMQAMNVHLVDGYLEDWEAQLLAEYIERERTPTESALFVSALSQMWIFATYELLRTWKSRASEIVRWARTLDTLEGDEHAGAVAANRAEVQLRAAEVLDADIHWRDFERASEDAEFVDALRSALSRTAVAFHAVEAVRVWLAKHEVPRRDGLFAGAPGYGRIDMETGSIYWQVELGRDEVAIISRRGLADTLRALARPNDLILPTAIQERIAPMERQAYGRNRVVVVLDDGTEVRGVHVLWATEVVWVEGHEAVPFDAARIVDVRADPAPEIESDADSPF